MKQMTVGQRTLHEIAMDAEKTREFLLDAAYVAAMSGNAERYRRALLFAVPLAFVVGFIVRGWV